MIPNGSDCIVTGELHQAIGEQAQRNLIHIGCLSDPGARLKMDNQSRRAIMSTACQRVEHLDRLGRALQDAAAVLAHSPPSHRASEACIAEVERICAEARRAVRGG